MPRMGVLDPAASRATRNIVPSPPKTRIRSAWRDNLRASALRTGFNPARSAVGLSLRTRRPASAIRAAAFWTAGRQSNLSALAMSPTRLILSDGFFKQRQKFLVARRAEQRRFHHAQPTELSAGGDECFQLEQDALMNPRVGDDSGAFVRFLPAGLKLGFDEGDHPAAPAQQSGGGRQDFHQRNE